MIWSAIWYWLLLLFSAIDIITTKIGLASGGGFYEANSLIVPALEHIVELKILVVVVTVACACLYDTLYRGRGWVMLALGSCFTFSVIVWNIIKLLF